MASFREGRTKLVRSGRLARGKAHAARTAGRWGARRRDQCLPPLQSHASAGSGLRGFRLNLAVEAAGSYEELLQVVPKIRDAVGPEKFRPLESVLNG